MTPEERAKKLTLSCGLVGTPNCTVQLICSQCAADAIRAAETEERAAILTLLEDGWRTLGPLQIIEAIRARGDK